MPRPINYRRRLLSIVSAFQDPSAASQARAQRLVHRRYHDPRRRTQTLDGLVWGTLIVELTDSQFYERPEYLEATRKSLLPGSPELHRAYLSYDFRPAFSAVEHDWHARLCKLAA